MRPSNDHILVGFEYKDPSHPEAVFIDKGQDWKNIVEEKTRQSEVNLEHDDEERSIEDGASYETPLTSRAKSYKRTFETMDSETSEEYDERSDQSEFVTQGANDTQFNLSVGSNLTQVSNQGNITLTEQGDITLTQESNEVTLTQHSEHSTDNFETLEHSDYEDSDTEDFTHRRQTNKKNRYLKRDQVSFIPYHQRESNSKFVNDMKSFMKNIANLNKSTIGKTMNHIFFQVDSLLNFETGKNENFTLEDLRDFNSNNYSHLRNPNDWFISTVGTDGNKGNERLKAHANLRAFLNAEVDRFSTSEKFWEKKKSIKENLEGIGKDISSGRLYKRYSTLTNVKKQRQDKAKIILNPSLRTNLEMGVRRWHASEEKRQLGIEMDNIYTEAMTKEQISKKDFTDYSNYARMTLVMSDRNRGGVYTFTIGDYIGKGSFEKEVMNFHKFGPDTAPPQTKKLLGKFRTFFLMNSSQIGYPFGIRLGIVDSKNCPKIGIHL